MCVIDDREDVWNFATNVIQVKPYRYFKNTGDINAPLGFAKTERNTEKYYQFSHPKKTKRQQRPPTTAVMTKTKQTIVVEETKDEQVIAQVEVEVDSVTVSKEAEPGADNKSDDDDDDDDDDYLYYLEEILRRIHTAFYQMYDHMSESDRPPDLHSVIPYVKLKVLKNVNLVFSSVIPTNVRAEETVIYNLAKSFGAVVQENLVGGADSTSATTHLVAGKWGTNKVREAQTMNNVKIVSPQWLWCCAERWERVDERLFPLPKDADFTKLYTNLEGNVRRIRREFKDATEDGVKMPQNEEQPKIIEGDGKNVADDTNRAVKRKSEEISGDESLTKKFKNKNFSTADGGDSTLINETKENLEAALSSGDLRKEDTRDSQDANGSASASTTNDEDSDSNDDDEIVKALERELSEQNEGGNDGEN